MSVNLLHNKTMGLSGHPCKRGHIVRVFRQYLLDGSLMLRLTSAREASKENTVERAGWKAPVLKADHSSLELGPVRERRESLLAQIQRSMAQHTPTSARARADSCGWRAAKESYYCRLLAFTATMPLSEASGDTVC